MRDRSLHRRIDQLDPLHHIPLSSARLDPYDPVPNRPRDVREIDRIAVAQSEGGNVDAFEGTDARDEVALLCVRVGDADDSNVEEYLGGG